MPVVGVDGVLDHRDLAAGACGVARHDRLDRRGLGRERLRGFPAGCVCGTVKVT